ncbi:MAG: bifunctional tRNA (5-methylaminomethyl-2-thiouridine)(34)-methyltransferase MnmD/FAD-dependent 5-carboxymethylaminomethyl-2-thiouridine(34) oxidoreductase MnmC [Burkholderiales bacterium]
MAVPLTPARLHFTQQGVPYSEAFDDVYHSTAGGVGQARHVFLNGNNVTERWSGRERFVILETGFGAGINFLATWQAWRSDPLRPRRLHFVSIEKHPFAAADAKSIFASLPEIRDEAAALAAKWPTLVPGAQRIELDGGSVVLTLFFADVGVARDLRLAADAFYLDGFAPAKNPDMWTPALMRSLARLAAPGATAATWSVAATLRHALEETGFVVEKRAGFGEKREMLVARYAKQGRALSVPQERTATVVGAGLAGAAVCERLCARGWSVTLLERHAGPAREASGNHAGAFHPLVSPDDSVFARVTRAAFLASLQRWTSLEARWDACGVLQLARDEKEALSQRRSVAALALPPDYAQLVSREEAAGHAGVPVAAGGLWFARGGWVQPASLAEAQLLACGERLERRFNTEAKDLSEFKSGTVILANAGEALRLHPLPHLRLRRVRGQVTYVPAESVDAPRAVVLRGGMVLPALDGICVVGATYDLGDEDPAPRVESHASNLERVAGILPGFAFDPESVHGRVAFRAVTADRLPVVGNLSEKNYGAFAYGSRGLLWSTLAAELIASELHGDPLPLEGTLCDALSPARFARRAARRAGG